MTEFKHLVLVPGHAVWNLREDPALDSSWYLKPYQNNEPKYFLEHIKAGVEAAAQDPEAILMFSGGATDPEAGPITEALGYWLIADWYEWWGHGEVRARAVLEEFALDSFLNVLCGLYRFQELQGEWPSKITVCGWGFKRHRIADLHRKALGWTKPFHYIEVNDPPNVEEVRKREAATCREFEASPWGEEGPIAEKRKMRDYYVRVPGYDMSDQSWR